MRPRPLLGGDRLPRLRGRGVDWLLGALLLFYAVTALRFAWVGDDAFITLRTVDNCGRGHGLTWNTDERVQAYTHPLWMLVLLAAHLVTGELYFTAIGAGFLVSSAAALLFARSAAPSRAAAAVGLAFLCGSRAFIDYSTSGLENPMTHLLIVAFFVAWSRPGPPARRLLALSALTALAATNRMDTALLLAPALLVEAARDRSPRGLAAVALGLAPFLAWEAFAVVYYGFPFPNTAYAKLSTGLPRAALVRQGFLYLADSLSRDPTTLFAVAASLASVVGQRRWRELPFAAGVLLYLAYIVEVGGDFMSGRFFTGPLMVAAILLARSFELTAGEDPGAPPDPARGPLGPALRRIALAALTAIPGNLAGWLDGPLPAKLDALIEHGIADERRYYLTRLGIGAALRGEGPLASPPAPDGGPRKVALRGAIGVGGVLGGPSLHIIDVLALADPLLARLPTHRTWRVGHYGRVVPFGYVETLETGEDHFLDRDIAALYDRLSIVTRGPLFSRRRWVEIWRLNTGAYASLVDRPRYANPPRIELTLADLPGSVALPRRWDAPGSVLLSRNGARIALGQTRSAPEVEATLACGGRYRFTFRLGSAHVADREIDARRGCAPRALSAKKLRLGEQEARGGYDALLVVPLDENGQSSLAALSLR